MKLQALLVLLIFIFSTNIVHAKRKKLNIIEYTERKLVKTLKRKLKCKSFGKQPKKNCSLLYKGLKIDFLAIRNNEGGSMQIRSLGNYHSMTNLGTKCIVITFNDPAILKNKITGGVRLIFRNDGIISHSFKNRAAKSNCY